MGLLDLIPGLDAIGNVASSIINNKAQKDLSVQMFNMNRQAALDDWNRNNEYNSPKAQMQRFTDAGLNPNLIYGQMTQSPSIKTPEASTPNLERPKFDMTHDIQMVQQIKQSNAQTNLINQQAKASAEDAALKAAQRNAIDSEVRFRDSNTALNTFNLNRGNSLLAPSLEAANLQNAETRQRINKLSAETGGLLQAQDIAAIMLEPNKQKIVSEIALNKSRLASNEVERNMWRSLIHNNELQGKLHEWSIQNQKLDWNQKLATGLQPHDPVLFRLGAKAIREMTDTLKKSNKGRYISPLIPRNQ